MAQVKWLGVCSHEWEACKHTAREDTWCGAQHRANLAGVPHCSLYGGACWVNDSALHSVQSQVKSLVRKSVRLTSPTASFSCIFLR